VFSTGQWRSDVDVSRDRRPLWMERQHLQDPAPLLSSPWGLGGNAVVGTLLLLGQDLTTAQKQELKQIWQDGGFCGPSFALSRALGGVVARYWGASSQEAQRGFVWLWQRWYMLIRGQQAIIPRWWS
jgi:urease accessory protein